MSRVLCLDLLFQRRSAAFLQAPCRAWAAVGEDRRHLDPWAAWAEGEVVVVAWWCRVRSRMRGSAASSVPVENALKEIQSCCLEATRVRLCRVRVQNRALRFDALRRQCQAWLLASSPSTSPQSSFLHSAAQPATLHAMKPGSLPLRAQSRPVCQLCDYILQRPAPRRSFLHAASTFRAPPTRRQPANQHVILSRISTRGAATVRRSQEQTAGIENEQRWGEQVAVLKTNLAEVERHIAWIKSSKKVEPETATLEALSGLQNVARQAIAIRSGKPPPRKMEIKHSSAGAILSMGREEDDAPAAQPTPASSPAVNELPSPQYISRLAMDLLKHPTVFISPQVLEAYINLQRFVGCPRAIPEILHLYANKPVPELGSSPPKFSKPSPKAAKQAIPAHLAASALGAAIEAKDMPLALAIVDVSYCAPAWRRHRMITKLGLPGFIASVTPLAIYMIAQEASVYSGFMEPWLYKTYAFLGISTYVLCTGTLGFVALTTHNDHHTRVVWRPGTPLLDRYMREDERAALDRIACAWGFKEDWRRGDEEGEEWEGLREWINLRDMVLDKPDLMPGMNA